MVVVEVTGGKGGQGFVVQGVGGSGSGFDDVAFVKLELDFSGYVFLASFTTGDLYDHHDASGFITLFGLPLKVRALKLAEAKATQN